MRGCCEGLRSGCWLLSGLLLASSIWVQACVDDEPRITIGRMFPFERLPGIRKGITTRQQVEELLGKPLRVDTISDERAMWRYFYRQETEHRIAYFFVEHVEVIEKEINVYFEGPFVIKVVSNSERF